MRNREKGSLHAQNYQHSETMFWCRKVWSEPLNKYVLELDEEQITPSWNSYFDDRETMDDVIGTRGKFNPCQHLRRIPYVVSNLPRQELIFDDLVDRMPNMGVGEWYVYGRRFNSCCFPSFSVQAISGYNPLQDTMPSIDWSNLVDQVGSQLDGHMTASRNLLVTIAEAGQTVRMFRNPLALKKLLRGVRRKLPLRDLLKTPANVYLEVQFGWKQLAQDVAQLARLWSELRHHKEFLEKTANQFTSLSSRETYTITPNAKVSTFIIGSIRYDMYVTKVTATACFSLDIRRTEALSNWSSWDQAFSRLGMNNVAEALWDIIPFSFVVDWFTHLNRFVGQSQHDFLSHDLRRIGHSIKTEWHGKCNYHYALNTAWWTRHVDVEGGDQIVQRKYERYTGFPAGTGSVGFFGNLNQTQLLEGLSLIVQRI